METTIHLCGFTNDEWDLVKAGVTGFIAFVSALFVFFAGKALERSEKKKKMKLIRDSFKNHLEFLDDAVITQKNDIEKFLKDFDTGKCTNEKYHIFPRHDVYPDFIDFYPKDELFKAFIRDKHAPKNKTEKERISIYNELLSALFSLKAMYKIHTKVTNEHNNLFWDNCYKLAFDSNELHKLFCDMRAEHESKHENEQNKEHNQKGYNFVVFWSDRLHSLDENKADLIHEEITSIASTIGEERKAIKSYLPKVDSVISKIRWHYQSSLNAKKYYDTELRDIEGFYKNSYEKIKNFVEIF